MTTLSRRALALAIGLALPALNGCAGDEGAKPADQALAPSPPGGSPKGPPGRGLVPEGPDGPGMGGPATPIKAIMRKVTAGPNSLTPKIGAALKAESPDWDAIQAQTKELATLAKELGTHEPPKGSKESWKELTDAFAETAEELDRAVQAKDKPAATAARGTLANSCMTCHNAHQNKRPGGPGGGFGPPGGGRPGGPGGGGPGGGPPGGSPPPGGGTQP